ncbi:hypothetical protein F5B20DRAFT_219429 [Whalleya microplaca]|nr:hypothetical protein F5B20DRAFT_219429 [Whalleya microplaca]
MSQAQPTTQTPDHGPMWEFYFRRTQDTRRQYLPLCPCDRTACYAEDAITYWINKPEAHLMRCLNAYTDEVAGIVIWELYWHPPVEIGQMRSQHTAQSLTEESFRMESIVKSLWDRREKVCGKHRHIYRE